MVDLPKLKDLDIEGKRVMVRGDLDVSPEKLQNSKHPRLQEKDLRLSSLIPTLKYLHEHGAKKIIIIGHRGRPKLADSQQSTADSNKDLSLQPVSKVLEEMLKDELGEDEMKKLDMQVMENLRFNPGEEENDEHFAEHLAKQADVYVNEAFSTSHRKHASFVALPQIVNSKCHPEDGQSLADKSNSGCVAFGMHFQKEIEHLSKILVSPQKPVVAIISGVKEDKLSYVEPFMKFSDKILIGGRLPEFIEKVERDGHSEFISESILKRVQDDKVVIAKLLSGKEDITVHSIEKFEVEIMKAGTIVLSGPVGKFEEEGHRQGTERVFKAVVANKNAFKVAGGGDTEKAISVLSLAEGFDWISVGGGAMLEYLASGTLPAIEALAQ